MKKRVAEIMDQIHELNIKKVALFAEWAMAEGFPVLADFHRKEMERLIAQRSPAQVARMEAALDRALETFK